jgi:hypothetical protein
MARNGKRKRDWRLLVTATVASVVLLLDLSLIVIGGAVAGGWLQVG